MDLFDQISDNSLPPLLIAELSGNHGGDLSKAIDLIEAAVESGADAIKLQTYKPETITVRGKDDRFLLKDGLWAGQYLHDLYNDAMTPWDWHEPLSQKAQELGVELFSSPFDETAVDFLESSIDPQIYKVASFELNHFPLLQKIGACGKPVLASVGVSNFAEIKFSLDTLFSSGCPAVTLLHCVSEYPAKLEDFNLASMLSLKNEFGTEIGLSDHSLGHSVPIAATALGARVIEKHFALDREESSIDGGFSMLPEEFKKMTTEIVSIHSALGNKRVYDRNTESKGTTFKRSILVSSPVKSGDLLTRDNIRVARPGDGLCPSLWFDVLGAKAITDMDIGHPLSKKDFNKNI